jgi:hypothetical protein
MRTTLQAGRLAAGLVAASWRRSREAWRCASASRLRRAIELNWRKRSCIAGPAGLLAGKRSSSRFHDRPDRAPLMRFLSPSALAGRAALGGVAAAARSRFGVGRIGAPGERASPSPALRRPRPCGFSPDGSRGRRRPHRNWAFRRAAAGHASPVLLRSAMFRYPPRLLRGLIGSFRPDGARGVRPFAVLLPPAGDGMFRRSPATHRRCRPSIPPPPHAVFPNVQPDDFSRVIGRPVLPPQSPSFDQHAGRSRTFRFGSWALAPPASRSRRVFRLGRRGVPALGFVLHRP